jgi:hypothetical protein
METQYYHPTQTNGWRRSHWPLHEWQQLGNAEQ